jgi:hypothetical protein
MKKTYPILLAAFLAAPLTVRAANLKQVLLQKLGNYCIPADAETCDDPALRATYEKDGNTRSSYCKCPCEDQYYNVENRRCEDCDAGTSDRYATSCGATSCPSGYELQEIADTCPNGMVMETTPRRCDFDVGGVPELSSCPAGYGRL